MRLHVLSRYGKTGRHKNTLLFLPASTTSTPPTHQLTNPPQPLTNTPKHYLEQRYLLAIRFPLLRFSSPIPRPHP